VRRRVASPNTPAASGKNKGSNGVCGEARKGTEPVELGIERVAYGGAGVAKSEGMVVFVPFTIPGEVVTALPVRKKKRFCEAELIHVQRPSPIRQAPVCEWFGRCGGCAYQHVPYATQLEWKTSQVRDLFQRIGGIENPPVITAVASPREFRYRNRVRVHVSNRGGKLEVGFYARGGREVVDVQSCPIAVDSVNNQLAALRGTQPPPGEYILSDRPDVLFFEQTNDGAADELAMIVTSLAGEGQQLLVDAYCGAGFFGHLLAPRFERVVGIESHPGAVNAALSKAGPNESYLCGDVAALLPSILDGADPALTTVLLDPPAAGLSPGVIDALARRRFANLVYVSCDPSTQARDLRALLDHGYRLESATPLDMFPQTSDIEVVASLSGTEKILP
jgi:tRNA/tmRNA/rRNA uracil-C5-methylase (TrmA/RlmC/RlmD family)